MIYTDADTVEPNITGFGLFESPGTECSAGEQEPSQCIAPFVLYHDLPLTISCAVDWYSEAGITYKAAINETVSEDYASWYLQAGGWESPNAAINGQPTCDELDTLHTLTNRLGHLFGSTLPFGGFREEIWAKIFNQIKVLPTMGQFWKSENLTNDSVIYQLYFASYQGLFIQYPAQKIGATYNPLIRPWYRLAASYPHLFVVTTPYKDFGTDELVATGATAIIDPNTTHTFGVAAFDYKFSEFLEYCNATLSAACQMSNGHFCYLIDSNAFLLYYHGIEDHLDDDDISHKFLGDLEPTLMQNMLDIGFFSNYTHTNYVDDSMDISYSVNDDVYQSMQLNEIGRSFDYNSGLYTVHQIAGTNLYLVHVDGWSPTMMYPSDCPDDPVCSSVRSPGCITDSEGDCVSIVEDICETPDVPTLPESYCLAQLFDGNFTCILELDVQSDMCASNFDHDCIAEPTTSPTNDPTVDPTSDPTVAPSSHPTQQPTAEPTQEPTADPSAHPTSDPTAYPTEDPTVNPTTVPTTDPTTVPTTGPTTDPTEDPVSSNNIWNISEVSGAIDSFKSELNTLFCDGLSVGGPECGGQYGIQNFIGSFHEHFETRTENVTDVVNQIMDRVDNELNVRAGFLTTMAETIKSSCNSYRWGGIHSGNESLADFNSLHFAGNNDRDANLPSDITDDPVYGQRVSLTKSTYRLPNNVDYRDEHIMKDAAVSLLLEKTMVHLHEEYCKDELSGFQLYLARPYCMVKKVAIHFKTGV